MALEHVILATYVACLLLLFVYSMSMAHLALVVRRARSSADDGTARVATPAPAATATAPTVTVQVPIYNELHVARRVIDAVARLEHPGDRLRIRILDDSTDATRAVVDDAVARHRAAGTDITAVRRPTRTGYKAGALAHALVSDTSTYVAVLDADFVPRPELGRVSISGV